MGIAGLAMAGTRMIGQNDSQVHVVGGTGAQAVNWNEVSPEFWVGAQTYAQLTNSPVQGDVLIAIVGIKGMPNTPPGPPYQLLTVSNITQQGITWIRAVNSSGLNLSNEIWYGIVGSGASRNLTFNLGGPPSTWIAGVTMDVVEYNGITINSPLDTSASNFGFGAVEDTGTAIARQANELWVGAITSDGSVPLQGATNGFEMFDGQPNSTLGYMATAFLEKISGSGGSANTQTSATYNGEQDPAGWAGCIATFFASDQTSSKNASPSPTPSPTPQNTTQPILQFTCQSTTSSTIEVNIKGTLTINCAGIEGVPILLSYSVNNGGSWRDLTAVYTDSSGGFTVLWTPEVTGNYLVKAVWAGDSDFPVATTIVNFAVSPMDLGSFFIINSNSTLSELSFDSATKQLTFAVNGSSGTTGYVDVYIPKSLVSDVSGLKVNLDGNTIAYSSQSQGDSWLVSFTYPHSTHQVTMNLKSAQSNVFSGNQLVEGSVIGVAVATIAIAIVFLIVRKNKLEYKTHAVSQ